MFAVQNGGWCAASETAPRTFDKYGKSTACKADGEGGPWANQVYVFNGRIQAFYVHTFNFPTPPKSGYHVPEINKMSSK